MNTEALNIVTPNESGDSKTNNLNPSIISNTSHETRKYRGGNLPNNRLTAITMFFTASTTLLLRLQTVFSAGRRFRAVMQLDGVRHNLGMHSTEIEAARAYDKFARVRRILTIQK